MSFNRHLRVIEPGRLNPRPPRSILDGGLRLVAAGALVVDAVVHQRLARRYNLAAPGGIGQGTLFRTESVVAILAAALVLGYGNRLAYGLAFLVAASAAAAAVLYRYVDVPAIGPIPAMYEPAWFGEKIVATAAEALGALIAAAGWATSRTRVARTLPPSPTPATTG